MNSYKQKKGFKSSIKRFRGKGPKPKTKKEPMITTRKTRSNVAKEKEEMDKLLNKLNSKQKETLRKGINTLKKKISQKKKESKNKTKKMKFHQYTIIEQNKFLTDFLNKISLKYSIINEDFKTLISNNVLNDSFNEHSRYIFENIYKNYLKLYKIFYKLCDYQNDINFRPIYGDHNDVYTANLRNERNKILIEDRNNVSNSASIYVGTFMEIENLIDNFLSLLKINTEDHVENVKTFINIDIYDLFEYYYKMTKTRNNNDVETFRDKLRENESLLKTNKDNCVTSFTELINLNYEKLNYEKSNQTEFDQTEFIKKLENLYNEINKAFDKLKSNIKKSRNRSSSSSNRSSSSSRSSNSRSSNSRSSSSRSSS